MSTPTNDAPEMLDVLRSGPVGVTSPEDVEKARGDMLPWLESQIAGLPAARNVHRQEKHARRLRAYWVGGGFAVAAAAALAFFVSGSEPEGRDIQASFGDIDDAPRSEPEAFATVVSGRVKSESMEVFVGSRIGLSSRVATTDTEGATLSASTGVQIELDKSTQLSLASGDGAKTPLPNRLVLHQGRADFSVPPLPSGQTFVVRTDDVEVTVIGTKFSVAHEGEFTCVRVSEGKVRVARGGQSETLTRGQSSGCDAQKKDATKTSLRSPRNGASPSTTLAAENALLTRALSAESQGDHARARRAFSALLAQYPQSAFAEDARDGLKRLDRVPSSE